MKISILTLFPEMFKGPFDHSILKRAKEKNILLIEFVNIRDFGIGKHKIVDDKPYGGGVGMVLRSDVVKKAVDRTKCTDKCKERIILLTPQGEKLIQEKVKILSFYDHLILVCGHYEGIDERIRSMIDEEISIGDYILTGGEIAAMVLTDSISRLLPGVLGKDESSQFESFQEVNVNDKKIKLLEYPQYTRPYEFEGEKVPNVLISGNHKKIKEWRKKEAFKKTEKKRPDLIKH